MPELSPPSRPRRRVLRFAAIAVGVLVLCIGVVACQSWIETGRVRSAVVHVDMNETDVERTLGTMTPVGSTVADVARACDDAGLEHSEFLIEDRTVLAMIRDPRRSMFTIVRKEYQLVFTFDEQQKLRSVECKPGFTGP